MFRSISLLAAFALAAFAIADDKKDPPKPTVDLAGSVKDEKLEKDAPAGGVIVSQKGWEKLAAAWDIKDAPKVDFSKELLVVATTHGGKLNLTAKADDKGDLKVL